MWGSVGITYNLDMVKERLPNANLNSMETLLNPENAAALADCGISLLDSPNDIGFMILSYLGVDPNKACLLYTSPSPRDRTRSRMPSSA